jgi:hypothetical protein
VARGGTMPILEESGVVKMERKRDKEGSMRE